jgi:hypothetical protein
MRIYYLLMVISIVLLQDCSFYFHEKYQLQRQQHFNSNPAYLRFLRQKSCLDSYCILLPKKNTYMKFYKEQLAGNADHIPFLGGYLDDSMQIMESDWLSTQRTCANRIITEVNQIVNNPEDSIKTIKVNSMERYEWHVYKAKGDDVDAPKTKAINLYFIYAAGFGKLYDSLYQEVSKIVQSSKRRIVLYIIAIDPIY